MSAEGLSHVSWRPSESVCQRKPGRDVLADPFLRKHGCSQLELLSDEEYAAGMDSIRSALEEAVTKSTEIAFNTRIIVGMIVGQR
jgi:hypothetical protein